jgi:type I restriction enzyme S subunit
MSAPVMPLGEVCEMDRQGLRSDSPVASGLPYVGVEHVGSGSGIIDLDGGSRIGTQKSTTFRFDERHILYAKLRPYLNKVATPEFAGKCSTELVPLLPKNGIDRSFLAHLLRRQTTVDFVMSSVTGSRMPRTDMKALLSMPVLVPSLDEQRRIAGILDRAAKIERLRARARKLMGEFIPALFVRMFGDPVENPMRWRLQQFGEVVEEFRYGTSKKCITESTDGTLPILRIPNVLHNAIDWNDTKFAALDAREANAVRLRTGDILFVRTNGNPELVGRCAVFRSERDAGFASYLIRARILNEGPILPEYAADALGSTALRKIILRLARTTAGNYNVNIASLASLPLPVPPPDRQRQYTELIEAARSTLVVAEAGSRVISQLNGSLTPRLLADFS